MTESQIQVKVAPNRNTGLHLAFNMTYNRTYWKSSIAVVIATSYIVYLDSA